MVTVHRVPDLSSLIDDAAARFVDTLTMIQADATGGINGDGIARVVLTGGGAGIGLLRTLAASEGINWSQVYVYFGDERNVPVSDPDSNEGQARAALLDEVDIPADHIFGYGLGEKDLDTAVSDYHAVIERTALKGFDIHLLGMGHEGHINSLFPHTSAVDEQDALVVAVTDSPKPPAERASLTLPAIARAQRVWLLVDGDEKAEAASHVAHGADANDWPAAGARGAEETILFVSDSAATQI